MSKTGTIQNPMKKPWVQLAVSSSGTNIQLSNSGAYLLILIGNATQSEIITALVGATGNVTHTTYGSNSSLTITDGTGNGIITLKPSQNRNVYIFTLNDAAPAKLAT